LAPSGRFVKCPVQVQNSEGASGKLLTWNETPCFCNLTAVNECPHSKETKGIISKRLRAHSRKENERKRKKWQVSYINQSVEYRTLDKRIRTDIFVPKKERQKGANS
jgi:hypothetical protein